VNPLVLVVAGFALVCVGGFSAFGFVSVREGERRAARISFGLAGAAALGALVAPLLPATVLVIITALAGLGAAASLVALAIRGRVPSPGGRPVLRVDERDIMFARGRLKPGSPEYDAYYELRPENRKGDALTRSLPGLLSPKAEYADEVVFAAAEASFDLTESVRDSVNGQVANHKVERSPEEWTAILKRYALSYGAVDVGVAELLPCHVYSHIGRGTGVYGGPVELEHRWALAFTVEMDHRRVGQAPLAPVVEESARQYVEGAKIAIILAAMVRRLGFPARAHIDGNYRVIAPLVARDAGLGEIGRMGLLMTPRLGPRVRLGVVTTELPLVADRPGDDPSVLDFCSICKKCAVNCPVGAIPRGDRAPIEGGLRWAIDSETCFRFWNAVGTDCATCVRACPYSHPDNPAHNMVRWFIARSAPARRAMLWLDDVFYGKKLPSIDKLDG
jgi:ferredoxin